MEGGQLFGTRIICVHFHILTHTVGRPKTGHGPRGETLIGNDVLQHFLPVGKQLLRFLAFLGLVENRRVHPVQLPRPEKGRPIDVGGQHIQRNGFKMLQAKGFRRVNLLGCPIVFRRGGAGIGQGHDVFAAILAAGKFLT